MSKQKEIIRQAGLYSVSTLITQFITVIAAFLTRIFLGPTQMGIWSTLQILVDYSKYAAMGTMSAVSVEIPYWVGKGDPERAENIKNTAFTFMLMSTLIFCGLIAGFAFLTQGRFAREVTLGLYFVAAVIFLQRMSNLLISLLRCYKKFHIESGQMILSSIVNAVLVAALASRFKIYGFIWALALSFLFNILYLLYRHRYHFRFYFNKEIFRSLILRGFPLMLLGLLTTGYQNIDRMFIAKMMGFEFLGFYSIALMACAYMSNFSIAATSVLIPHFQEKFGQSDNPQDLREYLYKSSLTFALIVPVLIVGAWTIAPFLIVLFLPKFVPGILAMKILSLSMFFAALIQTHQNFLITVKKHMVLFPIMLISIAVSSGLSWLAIVSRWGIEGVAAAVTFSALLCFSICYFAAARSFSGLKDSVRRFLIFLSCFGYLFVFLMLESCWLAGAAYGWRRFAAELVFAILVCLPLLWAVNKRFSFFKHLLGKFHAV